MKTLKFQTLIVLCLSVTLVCCYKKSYDAMVMDHEHLLTDQQKVTLTDLYLAHKKKTGNQIALITTEDYGEDTDISSFATNTGNKLGIGEKDKDNGLLIVVSQKNRETRISTGMGTEKVLKDYMAKKIIDSLMIPEFKKGNIYEGIYAGSKAITSFLEQPENEIR